MHVLTIKTATIPAGYRLGECIIPLQAFPGDLASSFLRLSSIWLTQTVSQTIIYGITYREELWAECPFNRESSPFGGFHPSEAYNWAKKELANLANAWEEEARRLTRLAESTAAEAKNTAKILWQTQEKLMDSRESLPEGAFTEEVWYRNRKAFLSWAQSSPLIEADKILGGDPIAYADESLIAQFSEAINTWDCVLDALETPYPASKKWD